MSSLIVEVCSISEILPHDNADKLEIAKVKGWHCIVQKGKLKVGDPVVYAPIDSVIPTELSDKMGVTNYLSKGRVKTTKLRGYISQGLIIPTEYLPDGDYSIGQDVKDILGITKYEPPIKGFRFFGKSGNPNKLPDDPRFIKYTDIENIKNFPDTISKGEEVFLTEKIHGTNFRCMRIDEETFLVGSRNLNLRKTDDNIYWIVAERYKLDEILPIGYAIYGEIYGAGIQKLNYDLNEYTAAFFDMSFEGKYLSEEVFSVFCKSNNLPMVPVLFKGQWDYSLMKLANGKSEIASHIREGFVVKPCEERWDPKLGRVILKHISEEYLLKKGE